MLILTCASGLFSHEDLFLVNNSRQVDVRSITDPQTDPQIYLQIFKKKVQLNLSYRIGHMKPLTFTTRQKNDQKERFFNFLSLQRVTNAR